MLSNISKLTSRSNTLVFNPIFRRAYHSVARSGLTATEGQTPVVVYDSPEYDAFTQANTSANGNLATWDS